MKRASRVSALFESLKVRVRDGRESVCFSNFQISKPNRKVSESKPNKDVQDPKPNQEILEV